MHAEKLNYRPESTVIVSVGQLSGDATVGADTLKRNFHFGAAGRGDIEQHTVDCALLEINHSLPRSLSGMIPFSAHLLVPDKQRGVAASVVFKNRIVGSEVPKLPSRRAKHLSPHPTSSCPPSLLP